MIAIAAVDKNYGIGYNNDLLFKIPADLKNLKRITNGGIVLMGRKTYESLGKALDGRINIVLSRNVDLSIEYNRKTQTTIIMSNDANVDHIINGVIKRCCDAAEIFVIGGGSIYEKYIDRCDALILTHYDKAFTNVDTYFPNPYEHGFIMGNVVNTVHGMHDGCGYSIIRWKKELLTDDFTTFTTNTCSSN